jgi:TIR domain
VEEPRDTVFISYSHRDAAWLERLHVMLKPLIRSGAVGVWDDTRISPGRPWREEIENALRNARVAVLLVTPQFLASDFIDQNELPPLLEAAERKGLRVLWVAVSASLYTESPIARFQAVNNPSKPLDRYLNRPARLNEELLKIAQLIKAATVGDATQSAVAGHSEQSRTGTFTKREIAAESQPTGGIPRESATGEDVSLPGSRMSRRKLGAVMAAGVLVFAGILGIYLLRTRPQPGSRSADEQVSGPVELLSTTSSQNLKQARKSLERRLPASLTALTKAKQKRNDAWTIAQVTVALAQSVPFDHAPVIEYLQATRDQNCGCWKEYGGSDQGAVSCWALLAFAKIEAPSVRNELNFLLDEQNPDGSWSIAPTTGLPSDSSTYATSWALLVLDEYRRKHRVAATQQKAVDQAIEQGVQYLLSAMRRDKARWLDYPKADDGIESISDSGLALHILNHLHAIDPAIDRLWLKKLPPDSIGIMEFENSGHRGYGKDSNLFVDGIRRYKLPWCLIATRDAYPSGSSKEKLAAQRWVEGVLGNPSQLESDAKSAHVAAELLIALRYLDGNSSVL